MNLKAIKKGINEIKETMGKSDEPSVQDFFKWCERNYYHRPVNIGELMFREYVISENGSSMKVKSDMRMFLLLSHRYFTEIHNTANPFKEGDTPLASLKDRLQRRWFKKYKPEEYWKPYNMVRLNSDPDYTKWFNEKWDEFIEKEDLGVFTEIYEDC